MRLGLTMTTRRKASPSPPRKKSVSARGKLSPVYQIKATLRDISPPVWRRVILPGDCDLGFLSQVLNGCFRWSGAHLHQFRFEGCTFGCPDPGGAGGEEGDERQVALNEVAPDEGSSFVYLYDFGDDWTHDVLVEEIRGPEIAGERGPLCLAGERAAPPEDCGGPWGYKDLLAALRDHGNPEHKEILHWIGGEFDPEAIDIPGFNKYLKKLRRKR